MATIQNDIDHGMALSGGGFRATLFSLGGLWRLNELGYLKQLDIITSVSGGSITSGVLGLNWKKLRFVNGVAENFVEQVVDPLRAFCKLNIDISAGVGGLLSIFDTIPEMVAKKYDEELFHGATLQDLPDETAEPNSPEHGPRLVFYATSLQTGASVRMSRKRLADYKIGEIKRPSLPLATVVAASSAFPPVLSPVELETNPDSWTKLQGAFAYDELALRKKMYLTDGGVYDNMGLEAIWERCKVVLVSDAGAPFGLETSPPTGMLRQTMRVLDIITNQSRALRKRRLIADFVAELRHGSYWGINTKIADYDLSPVLATDSPKTAALAKIRTRLDHFSDEEQGLLINWGYALADAAMRRHVLVGAPPGKLPCPAYPLD